MVAIIMASDVIILKLKRDSDYSAYDFIDIEDRVAVISNAH